MGICPQPPKQPKFFVHCSLIWSLWVASRRKIKIRTRVKKFSLLLKVQFSQSLWHENSTFINKLNFVSSDSNFNFSSQGNSGWPYQVDALVWSLNSVWNFLDVVDMCHLLLNIGQCDIEKQIHNRAKASVRLQ